MGKRLDALLGRTFKVSKFKSLVNLAISRLAVLKNQRQVRFSQATSDVSQLLQLGHHQRALLRVEQVIREQNMLDVFVVTEGYCNLLMERVHVIEERRECPDELKEAISSLLFASSRIGEFPELQEIRAVLTSRYGKEFAARSLELRNNCGVNPKMVQKLSTRHPGLEIRMKVLKDIAAENNIVLKLEEASASDQQGMSTLSHVTESKPVNETIPEEKGDNYRVSDNIRTKKKYKDVADAAQAAFESAADAAAAARAAVELSRSDDSHGADNNEDSPRKDQKRRSFDGSDDMRSKSEHNKQECKGADSEEIIVEVPTMSFREDPVKLLEKETVIYDSEEESRGGRNGGDTQQSLERGKKRENSGKDQILQREKGPISVRTRQVRGY